MNDYERTQADRRARLERAADRAEAAGMAAYNRARSATDGIPFGQPILVGHHSEGRHRAALSRSDSAMRRSVELAKLAESLRARAESVGSAGISSDDPEAVPKLEAKADTLEQMREQMTRINKIFKTAGGRANMEHAVRMLAAAVDAGEVKRSMVENGLRTLQVCHYESAPYPAYSLTNIGARIREAGKRVARLESRAEEITRAAIERGDDEGPRARLFGQGEFTAQVIENLADNRVELRFSRRLSTAEYKRVRAYAFLWSPTRKAFVRKFTGQGVVQLACGVARELVEVAPQAAERGESLIPIDSND